MLTVAELFSRAGLEHVGPVPWGTPVPEQRPGVYIVVTSGSADAMAPHDPTHYLETHNAARWIPDHSIVYIGTTRSTLHKRLGQFYRHRFGERSPHCGGQSILLLQCPLWVCWSATDQRDAEHRLVEAFIDEVGRLPFGNRRRIRRTALRPLD